MHSARGQRNALSPATMASVHTIHRPYYWYCTTSLSKKRSTSSQGLGTTCPERPGPAKISSPLSDTCRRRVPLKFRIDRDALADAVA